MGRPSELEFLQATSYPQQQAAELHARRWRQTRTELAAAATDTRSRRASVMAVGETAN